MRARAADTKAEHPRPRSGPKHTSPMEEERKVSVTHPRESNVLGPLKVLKHPNL